MLRNTDEASNLDNGGGNHDTRLTVSTFTDTLRSFRDRHSSTLLFKILLTYADISLIDKNQGGNNFYKCGSVEVDYPGLQVGDLKLSQITWKPADYKWITLDNQ